MCTTEEEKLFIATGTAIQGAEKSQMFGKPCFKTDGKAFICFFNNEMVFKLNGEDLFEALSLKGARLFDPSGKNRPMKEWVQLSYIHKEYWKKFADLAAGYVSKK